MCKWCENTQNIAVNAHWYIWAQLQVLNNFIILNTKDLCFLKCDNAIQKQGVDWHSVMFLKYNEPFKWGKMPLRVYGTKLNCKLFIFQDTCKNF